MKKKTYRAIIDNDGHITTMIVGGESKKSVTKELTDFFIKTKQIKDYRRFDIHLKEVMYINGEYKTIE
ncbi:MAG: hypothetical protein J6A15_05515 [Clostridia bacterium]|jgi:predicted urease superfamily metal-dependent hydrolase|nr:hypothetical protein [Bacillota bacterium]MBO5477194.1 hypothetical protein [Clostridia bacterium]NMA50578.1 hypothetical protein [Mollicutes bacterium]